MQFDPSSDFRIVKSVDFFKTIVQEIRRHQKIGEKKAVQPVFVMLDNAHTLITLFLSTEYIDLRENTRVLTERSTKMELNEAVQQPFAGQVTLLTREFAIGADFTYLDPLTLQRSKVHLLQTFLSRDISEQVQMMSSAKGSYSIIIEDDVLSDFGIATKPIRDPFTIWRQITKQQTSENTVLLESQISEWVIPSQNSLNFVQSLVTLGQSNPSDASKSISSAFKTVRNHLRQTHCHAQPLKQSHHFLFALDGSGSLFGEPWQALLEAIRQFINSWYQATVDSNDLISYLVYDNEVRQTIAMRSILDFSVLNELQPQWASTFFPPAMRKARAILTSSELIDYTPVFIFICDGDSAGGEKEIEELARDPLLGDLRTFTIGFGDANRTKLEQLALRAGGKALQGSDILSLSQLFQEILSELISKG
jgi:uncharacterized protein YegL